MTKGVRTDAAAGNVIDDGHGQLGVDGGDYAMVALAAFLICTISTIYPAYAASELRPVDGLRWE